MVSANLTNILSYACTFVIIKPKNNNLQKEIYMFIFNISLIRLADLLSYSSSFF